MRIDLILLLASSAHLTSENCLAIAAGFEHPTTKDKASIESVDENRIPTSERSLRVRAPMDEEDEERVGFRAFTKKTAQLLAISQQSDEEKELSTIPLLSNEGATNSEINLREREMKRNVGDEMTPDSFKTPSGLDPQDELFVHKLLSGHEFLQAFNRDKSKSQHVTVAHAFTPLVRKGMTPELFETALKLDTVDALFANKLLVLDEFLQDFNSEKLKSEHVTVAHAFTPLVDNGMTPEGFVTALKLDTEDALFANKVLFVDEFVKAFNSQKPESPPATVARALTPLVQSGMTPEGFVTGLNLDFVDALFANKVLFIDEFVKAFNRAKVRPYLVTVAHTFKPLVESDGMTPEGFVTALKLNPKDAKFANKILLVDDFVKAFNRARSDSPPLATVAHAFTPLVDTGMTPEVFVTALKLDTEDALLANKELFLAEFVKAFNSQKPESERATIGQALESTPFGKPEPRSLNLF